MIFSRRRSATAAITIDPLLTRPRVAELIERDPARVTRYFQAELMPAPDEMLEGGVPAWRRSTIRSWWLDRGGHLDHESARYHSQWEQQGIHPELLEERIVDISNSTLRTAPAHIRAYRAMDGGGPVILLSWLRGETTPFSSGWSTTLNQLRAVMVTDVDLARPAWISVSAERWSDEQSGESMPDVELADVENKSVVVTPEDVARLIGQPFDIYPDDLYTAEAVAARRRSGGQDGPGPTAILADKGGIGLRMQHLRSLTKPSLGSADADTYRFAAGLIANDLRDIDNQLDSDAEFRNLYADDEMAEERLVHESAASAMHMAVFPQERRLSPHENQIVRQHELEPPLLPAMRRTDIRATKTTGIRAKNWQEAITLRSDALQYLGRIRNVLLDPDLPDGDPHRAALAAVEQLIASAAHRADAAFAAADKQPMTYTWNASSTEMSAYLTQLTPATEQTLPRHLKRRARSLLDYEYAQTWTQIALLHDEQNDLLAMTGLKPSNINETAARQRATSLLAQNRRAGQDFPHTPATEQALIEAYMADRAQVRMEWPQALSTVARDLLAGARLIAPPAADDVERPVFVITADGQFLPLSLNGDTHFRGFAWGVSNTDTLTPAVHQLFTSAPTRARRKLEEDDPGRRAYHWLMNKRIASSADRLDLNLDEILAHYSELPPVVGPAPAADRPRP